MINAVLCVLICTLVLNCVILLVLVSRKKTPFPEIKIPEIRIRMLKEDQKIPEQENKAKSFVPRSDMEDDYTKLYKNNKAGRPGADNGV